MDFLTSAAVTILSDDVELIKSRKRKFEFFESNNTTSKGNRAVRKWCFYAHFYSTLDQPYFNDNEFVAVLSQLDIDPFEKFTAHTWRNIRQLMNTRVGLPRRLSKHFLDGEREKLKLYREEARIYQQQATKTDCYSQFQMNDTIQVGDTVVVYLAALKEFCQGCVLSSMPQTLKSSGCAQYLVQLEEQSSKDNITATLKPMVFNDEYIYVVKSLIVEKPQPLFHQVSRQASSTPQPSHHMPSTSSIYDNDDDVSTVNFSQQSYLNGDSLHFSSQVFSSQQSNSALPPIPSYHNTALGNNSNSSSSSSSVRSDDEVMNPLKRSRSDISIQSVHSQQGGNETENILLHQKPSSSAKSAGDDELMRTSGTNSILVSRDRESNNSNSVVIDKRWQQNEGESERIVQESMEKLKKGYNQSESSILDYIQNDSQIIELLLDCVNSLLTLTQQQFSNNNDKTTTSFAQDKISSFIYQLTRKLGLSYDDLELRQNVMDVFNSIVTNSGVR